ncbi:MAG TPA: hypothetical protein VIV27_07285 [Halioglobus sp.]
MTQHVMQQDILEDQRIWRHLALVIACFVAFTVALAIGIGVTMG